MKYMVVIMDTFPGQNGRGNIMETPRKVVGLSLTAAWRVAVKNCRRGLALYGGSIGKENWGLNTHGGELKRMLDHAIRYATIYMDPGRNR